MAHAAEGGAQGAPEVALLGDEEPLVERLELDVDERGDGHGPVEGRLGRDVRAQEQEVEAVLVGAVGRGRVPAPPQHHEAGPQGPAALRRPVGPLQLDPPAPGQDERELLRRRGPGERREGRDERVAGEVHPARGGDRGARGRPEVLHRVGQARLARDLLGGHVIEVDEAALAVEGAHGSPSQYGTWSTAKRTPRPRSATFRERG